MLSIIIPILLIGLITSHVLFVFTKKDIAQKNTVIANTVSRRLDSFMNESFLALYQLRDLLETDVLENDLQINTYLQTLLEHSSLIESLQVIDNKGLIQNLAPANINLLLSNQSGQTFFSEVQSSKSAYSSSTFISQETGEPTLALAVPFNQGVLVAFLDLSRINLQSLGLKKAFASEISIAITDENGTLISHDEIEKVYQRDQEANFEELRQSDKNNSKITTANYDGQKMIVNTSSLNNLNWFVFVYQSYDSIFVTLGSIFVIISLLAILLVIFSRILTHFVFRTIDSSFNDLNSQSKEIAAGDYHLISIHNNFDEFQVLSENFNQMVKSIKERDDTLRDLAYYDLSTGLPNDSYLSKHLEAFIQDGFEKIAIICFNIRNFKRINDTYGPQFGDAVIKKTGQRILSTPIQNGFIARSASSNFIRVLYSATDSKSILKEIHHFQALFNEPIIIANNKIYLHFYVGVALYPSDAKSPEQLLQYAHIATDSAKKYGKNKIVFFKNTMKDHLLRNMTLEVSLRNALANDQLHLHYQPQINVCQQEIRGFEALLRWQHPSLGNIPPLDFIDIAESTGLIVPIGEWVLKTACTRMVRFNEKMGMRSIISVNISPIQLEHDGFPQMVKTILDQTGLSPDLLELEITENILIDSYKESIRLFNRLKKMGIKLSLDDFGTGYSSLSYLKNLPIDTLKIDQAFTRDLLTKVSHENLMKSMITMAHILDLKVIVEGVEEIDQFSRLKNFCCDCVQGYYFSKPMPEHKLEDYGKGIE